MKLNSWAVAAAILLKSEHCKHFEELAQEVMRTKLTVLGEKSPTPAQTLGSILRREERQGHKVFEKQGDGYYGLADRQFAQSLRDVQEAILRLEGLSSD